MNKYAQTKRFNYDRQLQIFMYDFMYFYPDTMAKGRFFQIKKYLVLTTQKC